MSAGTPARENGKKGLCRKGAALLRKYFLILKGGTVYEKWVVEDWQFELTAIDGKAGSCRLGIEKGDKFVFSYECPAGMCPRVMTELFTWCEVIRCGGNFTYRGAREKYEMDIPCPCRCIKFHLHAIPINRDENGNPLPNHPRPED